MPSTTAGITPLVCWQKDKTVKIYVDGQLSGTATVTALFSKAPADGLDIAADGGSKPPLTTEFAGTIDAIAISHTAATAADIAARVGTPGKGLTTGHKPVLLLTFDQSSAADTSGKANAGTACHPNLHPRQGRARSGAAPRHCRPQSRSLAPESASQHPANGYFVEPDWTKDIPIIARGMAVAKNIIFVAGPEDVVDEEDAVARMTKGDTSILPLVKQMDENLDGNTVPSC